MIGTEQSDIGLMDLKECSDLRGDMALLFESELWEHGEGKTAAASSAR